MGLLDRFRRTSSEDDASGDAEPALDLDARRAQLKELSSALHDLVAGMTGEGSPRGNPGWAERVGEYRVAAHTAARLAAAPDVTRTQVLDLCSEVRPVFVRRPGLPDPPPALLALEDRQQRVLDVVEALREVLPTERG